MRTMTRTLSALALTLAVSVAGAQQPDGGAQPPTKLQGGRIIIPPGTLPKKSALEEALDLALKNNPDLRVAASKLALADAELSRTRLQVTQKVAAAYADVLTQRALLTEMERQLNDIRKRFSAGAASREELGKAGSPVVEMKAKVDAAERELEHLQGKGGTDANQYRTRLGTIHLRIPALGPTPIILSDSSVRLWETEFDFRSPKTEGSDKLRQSLQKKVTLSGQKMPLTEYLALVKKTAAVSIQADTKGAAWKEAVDFDFEGVTVGGMLQFLEDSLTGHQVVVREYGLAIVAKEKVPPGAVTLTAFLHAGPQKAEEKKPGGLQDSRLRQPFYVPPGSEGKEKKQGGVPAPKPER